MKKLLIICTIVLLASCTKTEINLDCDCTETTTIYRDGLVVEENQESVTEDCEIDGQVVEQVRGTTTTIKRWSCD